MGKGIHNLYYLAVIKIYILYAEFGKTLDFFVIISLKGYHLKADIDVTLPQVTCCTLYLLAV